MESKALFGGAIRCSLPKNSVDLSDIRPVPNQQECWFVDTEQNCPISFTVEILEGQGHISDHQIAEHIFSSVAEDNDASDVSFFQAQPVSTLPTITPGTVIQCGTACTSVATAVANKNTFDPPTQTSEEVNVRLCVIRLPEKSAEILLMIMAPTILPSSDQQATLWMDEMIASFRIHDWGLFGS